MLKLLDTHVHLNSETEKDDLNNVLEKTSNDFKWVWNISWDLKISKEVIEINNTYKNILPIIGIHPNHTKDIKEESFIELENLIKNNKNIRAIGEIGLDYFRLFSPKHDQKEAFIKQLDLAVKYNLPIIIHSRDALEDTYEILLNYKNHKILIHSWSGNIEQTKMYLENFKNVFFSFNGILTYKNSSTINESFNFISKEKILLETDAPWLSPEPKRGEKNKPEYIYYVIEYVSKKWNLTIEKTLEIIENNSENFLKK